jgi:hypothetical protein
MRRTNLPITWLAAVLLAVVVAPPARAAEIHIECSVDQLRSAMVTALANDIIVLQTGCTYQLSGVTEDANASGDLDFQGGVATPLTLRGGGPRMTIIDGGGADRVVDVGPGRVLTIEGVTLQNGDATKNSSPTAKRGGGLFLATGSTLTLRNVTIDNNKAESGGGIFNNGGTLILDRVTISHNSTTSPTAGEGGGLNNASGSATLTNVTIVQNTAALDGGGIFSGIGSLTATNATIAGNITAAASGGGLSGDATLTNTILAGNTAAGGAHSDCLGNVTSTNNLVQTSADCTGLTPPADKVDVDPLLGPLQNNGGGTETRALGATSPAIDAGTGTGCPPIDQRGRPRGGSCDIGAVEFSSVIFTDVPEGNVARTFVEDVFTAGVTVGCTTNPLRFCPNDPVTRGQMAVFLLKAVEGSGFAPPPCASPTFTDVPCSDPFAPWIYELANRGITSGCAPDLFCPIGSVTREQMAVFLLKSLEGTSFTPPPCSTPAFADVPCSSPFAAWVNELARRTITSGCGGSNYCPGSPVTRGQMAVFLVRTFDLP